MDGNPLPDDNHVSRYCKPTDFSRETCQPKVGAFQRRQDSNNPSGLEEYLSVNWLEFFPLEDRKDQVQEVRESFRRKNYSVKPNGRFVVLNVAAVKAATGEAIGTEVSIFHKPCEKDPSHSAISGPPENDLEIAAELKLLVSKEDVYLAVN